MSTAFPRGKRKKPSSASGAAATAAASPSSSKDRPSKKRAPSSASGAAVETDFLFGSSSTGDASLRKKPSSRRRDEEDGPYDSDDEDYANAGTVASQLPLGGGAVLPPATGSNGRRVPPKIEPLTFSKYARGTKVLGSIREVRDEYALVGLPCMLAGYVRREEDGPPLTLTLPREGTMMAFAVLHAGEEAPSKKERERAAARGETARRRRRIELSPMPAHVNRGVRMEGMPREPTVVRGRIASVEDHGCMVDLGGILGGGRRAFLKFENVEGEYDVDDGEGDEEESEDDDEDGGEEHKERMDTDEKGSAKRKLNSHRVYDFTILPSHTDELPAVLQLALPSPTGLAKLRAPPSSMPVLPSLVPGMLATVRVEAHARNGLCVSFHRGVYRASLDEDHLGGHRGSGGSGKGTKGKEDGGDPHMWWRGVFKGRRAKFTARIIAVDAATKIIRFSLNPQILALNGDYATFPHPVGAVIKNAQVIRVDPGIGALLALPPAESASSAAEDGDHEEQIAKMDRELSNDLLSHPEYQAASRVRVTYVHISKSMDVDDDSKSSGKKGKQKQTQRRAPEALFARRFSINTRVPSLRILSAPGPLDGIAACATARSVVGAHVLTHADVRPGALYKDAPVSQMLDSGGVLVELGPGTRGIVPAVHLFDRASRGADEYRQRVRSAKYKVGSRIAVRCLTVDPAARQCVLTAKKTLLANDVDDPIIDYPSVAAGRVAAGFVTKVDDTGLTVTFYNNVHGRVTSRSLAAELGVEDVRKNYGVGDVVLARVVSCERRRNRHISYGDGEEYYYQLRLSLKTVLEEKKEAGEEEGAGAPSSGAVATEGDAKDSTAVPLAAGSVLMKKSMKVLQLVDCLHRDDGVFLPGYAIVAIKSKFFRGRSSDANAVECKLPYEQLLDSYGDDLSNPPMELDAIARGKLKVGKRVDEEGLVLAIPAGADALPIVSLRSSLIETAKKKIASPSADDFSIVCPSPKSNIFMGEYVRGYVARIDNRFGAFVRFLDGLTGLIPKLKKGLEENLYDSIVCKVAALDITSSPPKILLKKVSESEVAKKKKKKEGKSKAADGGRGGSAQIEVGDVVENVKVADVNFARAKVFILDDADSSKVRARIHVTMADALEKTKLSKKDKRDKEEHKIGKPHPFYSWNVGDVIPNVHCVAVDNRDGVSYVELSNLPEPLPLLVNDPSHLPPGSIVSAIVTSVSMTPYHGLWVQVCPGISGFVPALELSTDPDVLNDLPANYKVGKRITTCVMRKMGPGDKKLPRRHKLETDAKENEHQALELSALLVPGDDGANTIDNRHPSFKPTKPRRGDSVLGCINTKSRMVGPPSLMLNLRGGYVGRCCITELADKDDWENMPLGKTVSASADSKAESTTQRQRVVSSDSDVDHTHENEEEDDVSDNEDEPKSGDVQSDFPNGKYVKCRVLGNARSKGAVELSLRESRCQTENQDSLDSDRIPKPNEVISAYVVSTTKKGCFVRLSRSVEGRVILKELSESYVPDPGAMFPQGRLIVGKVKSVKTPNHNNKKGNQLAAAMVDIDMRESVLLTGPDRVTMESIEIHSKYTGVITRVESYGVFVRIDNSNVSGLAHVSECSDNYIKSLDSLYSPGDLVKAMVIKIDKEKKQLGFSLKASNFVDDDDSDEESTSSSGSESSSHKMDEDGDGIDSEDDDFATKLAEKMKKGEDMEVDEESAESVSSSEGSSSESESESSDSEEDESEPGPQKGKSVQMETDVGFDWGGSNLSKTIQSNEDSSDDNSSSSSDSSDDESEDGDSGLKSSHRARKKAAAKRREEEETSRREAALADGTADETPETSADFERLVASSPNSSEVWIKYMAFHLSLADVDAARNVANRAFERIEFHQEGEKLNVWTALLTLELKYGTSTSLHNTLDRASSTNNPKQVYLRLCELLEKEVDSATTSIGSSDLSTATSRADEMFTKMCKKFKSKKSVWIANFKYLLKGSRHEEAHALLKRSLQSLPTYKHVEVMSKFAQMEFELGSPERGRTIFNALLEKYPKRMDLLFVNIDKEVKNGDIAKARALFDSVVNPVSPESKFKFSDKQMKSLFKKWYRLEEDHGDEESQERVREEARNFVAKSTP